MNMEVAMSPYRVALIRGIVSAVLIGLTTFFTLAAQTHDWTLIMVTAGGAMTAALAARWGGEGTLDTARIPKPTTAEPAAPPPAGPLP